MTTELKPVKYTLPLLGMFVIVAIVMNEFRQDIERKDIAVDVEVCLDESYKLCEAVNDVILESGADVTTISCDRFKEHKDEKSPCDNED